MMKKPKINRNWDMLSEGVREKSINAIIHHFKAEKNEDIGILAAEAFLDFFLQLVGKNIYTKGVRDSQRALKQRFEDLDIDLELLIS